MYDVYDFYLKGDSGGPLHVRRSYGYLEIVGTYPFSREEALNCVFYSRFYLQKRERERERKRERNLT